MSFTDKDLTLLKAEIVHLRGSLIGMAYPLNEMEACIKRMELAELVVRLNDYGDNHRLLESREYQDAYDAWRKSCGRE